ncbi:MAG: hypothetical protein IIT55_05395, partial [Bacteroidaceae bacterium]|nr:hypothetical protein [Bacteroidaceae bacterium]
TDSIANVHHFFFLPDEFDIFLNFIDSFKWKQRDKRMLLVQFLCGLTEAFLGFFRSAFGN